MTRLPHWEMALVAFLTARRATPYAWGSNDCCLFAADGIQAITGVDLAAEFRGYSDEASAYAAIARVCGGKSAQDAVTYCVHKFELEERVTPLHAQRGDLVLVENAGTVIAGLVDMHGKASAVTAKGLYPFSIRAVIKAYRI